ncbi:hypothetical protein DVA86_35015 [Streptomyces armeniacus]|uniref:Type VI secretion protein n=1 Tax=Streptomyces armeniacus TaxID=83291 RepID=A0A345XZ82_9ACTN|nr:hypothetical protein DVA86_35015 [Streptomyces armeniacus]
MLVVTGDPDLYTDTVGARSKLGPAHVFDPAQLTTAPTRLRWAPHRDCEDMPTARTRAAALLAPVRSPARGDSAVHDAAETLLRCWLHAAAVAGEPFRQVHRWALSGSSKDAVRILRTDTAATAGAAGELEATLTAHAERREAATVLVRRALNALSQLHIRNACTPSRADRIAWDSFIPEGGTLYVVGTPIEAPHRADPGAMPLVTALTSAVVEHGRRMAERSSAGRLDPPLTVVLDHPATVAPVPELPALLADGTAAGLHTLALTRSEEQVRTWWPELLRGRP